MKRIVRTWFPLELIKNLLRLPFRRAPVEESVNMGGPDALGQVDARYDGVLETIQECTQYIRSHPNNRCELDQMEGYRFVAGVVRAGFNTCLMQDPAFPRFRHEADETTKMGLDNPDNKYLVATVSPQWGYRIWGNRGTSADLVLQLYNAMTARGGAALDLDSLVLSDDGDFEVILSQTRPALQGPPHTRNWLAMDDAMDTAVVRFSHQDWDHETPGEVHIDRLGGEGAPSPELSAVDMQERLDRAQTFIHHNVTYWVDFVGRLMGLLPPNVLPPLRTTQAEGLGLQVSSLGYFELTDDEALLVQTYPTAARYQGFQLGNFWNQSLEYGNRQTSLTAAQSVLSDDGIYRYVVSKHDPGVPNWLDTEGRNRGMMFLRFQGLSAKPAPDAFPHAQKVRLSEVRDYFPASTPTLDIAARREQLRRRQLHLKRRYDY